MSDNTPRSYAVKNYVSSAVDEFAPPPPYVETAQPQQTIVSDATIGTIVVSANLAVTILIIAFMLIEGTQAGSAVQRGILYFGLSTPIFLLIITGGLVAMINGWQHETTERRRIDAYERVMQTGFEWRLAVEETRQLELLGRRPREGDVQRVSPLNTFVPAIPSGEEAQAEGIRFAMSLYATNGTPDPKRLHPDGRLSGRMLGSKRGSGSRDAGLWLLREGIIKRVRGGYALDISRYPNRDSLRHLL
jgi:hypothetical protein